MGVLRGSGSRIGGGRGSGLGVWNDPEGNERSKAQALQYASGLETDRDRGDYLDPNAGKVRLEEIWERWIKSRTIDPASEIQYESKWDRSLADRPHGHVRAVDSPKRLPGPERLCRAGNRRRAHQAQSRTVQNRQEAGQALLEGHCMVRCSSRTNHRGSPRAAKARSHHLGRPPASDRARSLGSRSKTSTLKRR
jgi:hypothetical protein